LYGFLLINVITFTASEDYKKSPFRVRKLGLLRNCVTSRKYSYRKTN